LGAALGFAATLGLAATLVFARFWRAISGNSAVKSSRLKVAGSMRAPPDEATGTHEIMGVRVMKPIRIGRKCIAKKKVVQRKIWKR
jgi:hypothetical protein